MGTKIINVANTKSPAFTGHTLYAGKSGSGKTNAGEFRVENEYLFAKKKCIVFDTSGRLENTTWSLPERNPLLCGMMKNHPHMVTNFNLRPMGFSDEVLMICGRNIRANNKFPKNFKVVSFKESDLSWKFFHIILGKTKSLEATINNLEAKYGDDITMKDVWDIIVKNEFRGVNTSFKINHAQRVLIKNRINSWRQTGMFSDEVEKIDFKKIINNQTLISCVNTSLLETESEEEMAYALFLDKIMEYLWKRKAKHRLIVYIPEIHDFMSWDYCKPSILQILRKGRAIGQSGVDLICDTQRTADLHPKFRRQFGYVMQMKTDYADASKLLDIQFIPSDQLSRLPHLGVGQAMCVSGQQWDLPLLIPPTRHLHVSPEYNILDLLAKKHGGYIEYDPEKILFFEREKEEEIVVEVDDDDL